MKPQIDRTSEVDEALARLDEISKRSRHLGILLATDPVEDVERVVAVLSAGQFFRPRVAR
jgi:hypothetical protein